MTMTPADLATHIAARRAWWASWRARNPDTVRRENQWQRERPDFTPCHDDPPISVRASALEGLLVDAWLLAQVAATVDDLTDDEAAAVARHAYTHPRSETT